MRVSPQKVRAEAQHMTRQEIIATLRSRGAEIVSIPASVAEARSALCSIGPRRVGGRYAGDGGIDLVHRIIVDGERVTYVVTGEDGQRRIHTTWWDRHERIVQE